VIDCLKGRHVCRMILDGHPLTGTTFGVAGTNRPLAKLWTNEASELHADGIEGQAMTISDHLLRIADWLSQVELGSPKADRTIHWALSRKGPVLAYTRNEAAARLLLPEGFEWRADIYSSRLVYASCGRRRLNNEFPSPRHKQWGRTLPLAMCGAVLRVYSKLGRD
jgi:hypothetical protein